MKTQYLYDGIKISLQSSYFELLCMLIMSLKHHVYLIRYTIKSFLRQHNLIFKCYNDNITLVGLNKSKYNKEN